MDVISNKKVKIRKPHHCYACARKFEVGTVMHSQTNTYDGIATVYSCLTCDALMGEFKDWFLDDFENIYPEYCVLEVYRDFKINTPEELLDTLRNRKQSIYKK